MFDGNQAGQEPPGGRRFIPGDLLRRALRDDSASGRSAFGAEIDHEIRRFHDVEVVFDDHDRIALVDELVEDVEQLPCVLEMEPGRRLVEDVKRSSRAAPRQFFCELDPLRFAPGQGRRRLPELDVAKADVLQRAEFIGDGRKVLEERQRLIDGQVEHVRDRLAPVFDLQGFAVVPPALALLAGHVHVREEVHLNRDDAVPLTRFAAATLHVEREAPGPESARLGLGHHGEEIPDEGEQTRIGGGVGSRGPSDRRLIDLDHLVEQFDPLDAVVRAGLIRRLVQRPRERAVQDVVDQRGLARPAHAGDRCQHAERKPHVDRLQVVRAGATDREIALQGRPPGLRRRDRARPGQIRAGQRRPAGIRHQRGGRPLKDHLTAVLAGARAEVDHVIGGSNRLLVVFDNDDGVAQVAEPGQRGQEFSVVALVQTDRRLVEHVQHAGEVGPDLRGQPDALPFAARERGRAAAEREVPDADIVQEPQPILNLAKDALGDDRFAIGQPDGVEHLQRLGDRQIDVVCHRPPFHPDGQTLRLQPLPAAARARPERSIRFELGLLHPGAVFVSTAQIGHDPFELLRAALGRSKQQELALFARQLPERRRQVDPEIAAERLQRFPDQFAIAPHPGRDRALGQRLRFVGHEPMGIEVDHRAEPLAVRARAMGRVEREGARRHLRHADAALHARQPARKQPIGLVERVDDDDVVGEVQRDLHRFGYAALDAAADDQAIDHHVDRVIPAPIELDVFFERLELTVDPRLGEAFRAQRGELLLELALASPDHGREHVDARILRIEHHHVHDPLERLAGDLLAAVRTMRHADAREEQPQVVVDLGDGAHRRAGIGPGRLLFDGDRGRQAVDQIDVGLLHLLEKLPGVRRQRLDVAPLSFRVDRIEGERRLARARQAGDDDQAVSRDVDVDVLEVVHAGAAHRDPVVRHISRGWG